MTMTMDEHHTTDYGDAGSLGSGPASPRRRRTERPPSYDRSLLADDGHRSLAAGVLADGAAALREKIDGAASMLERASHEATCRTLDAIVDELTGQE